MPHIKANKIKISHLIWFFCFLIFFQVVWLELRLTKLYRQSPEFLLSQRQIKAQKNLINTAEPEVKIKTNKTAKLWLKPAKGEFNNNFKLEIWLFSKEPIKKASLQLFYPADMVELISYDWQKDNQAGIASWSGKLTSQFNNWIATNSAKQKITEVWFRPLKKGQAKISFDFVKESLLDCNLFNSKGEDILAGVEGGEYLINNQIIK